MADYSDLINKTIYDFCDDEKIIRKINPLIGKDYTKERYIDFRKNEDHIGNAFDLNELARITKNKALEKAVDEQFAEYADEYFNE